MLLNRTWNYITYHGMIHPGEVILAGVSGGADSVCLLLLLSELGQRYGFTVHAVHVNHNLRGRESDDDQIFVEELCREHKIPLHCFSCPVKQLASELQIGIEEAGREARTRVFRQCMDEVGAVKTALAHHRNDQAETVLFRLARGSSLGGLSGIRPCQGFVIHPLLFADKEEILRELEKRGAAYRTDSSNLTDHYTRNCIRHQILTVLEERVNDRSLLHIAEAAEDIAEADSFLRQQALPLGRACISYGQGIVLIRQELLREHAVLARYVLMDALAAVSGGRKNLGREQLRQLQDLLQGEIGRRNSLPGNIEAVRTAEGVVLRKKAEIKDESGDAETFPEEKVLEVDGSGNYSFGRWQIRCELLSEVPEEIPEKEFTKWLDYDKIKHSLSFRTRRPGDFLVTTAAGGRKKLKSYFIDEKIPAPERRKILLLASESRIFWVVGYRISEDCKVTAQTKKILKITISEDRI